MPPASPSASHPARATLLRAAWQSTRAFFGFGDEATHFLTRWLVLRAVGAVFVIVFAGIVVDHAALIGPQGIMPLADFFREWRVQYPNPLEAFLRAPSLFWLNSSASVVAAVAWAGLTAALALSLNIWPRVALMACWGCLLSFVATWRGFSATQVDQLMLETALVCIPFAPAGLRPGLGANTPPAPAAVFLVHWLLFRVMFENGLIKIFAGDAHWLDFSALDVLYETSPFPTFLGFLDHQLPHAWHVFEALLTYAAEIVAPIAILFGGGRLRWFAFIAWTAFQAGIQLTNNFGWLNTASIGLGLLLLDDAMLRSAAARWWPRLAEKLLSAGSATTGSPIGWRGLAIGHSAFTLIAVATTCGLPFPSLPLEFHSANFYTLFGRMLPARIAVEFEGSNDAGRTWRTYEFRYQPQREDEIPPFLAPRYARFEATLQVEGTRTAPSPLFAHVAAKLLTRSPDVIAQFRRDPFPEKPANLIRLPVYQLTFTDFATWRTTGKYWRKELTGFHQPLLYLDERGAAIPTTSAVDELRILATQGNPDAQYRLGVAHASGEGVPRDLAEAAKWYRLAAEQGIAAAQGRLGSLLLSGDGITRNFTEAARWFRSAADQGNAYAAANLGLLHARGEGVTRDESEACVWFMVGAALGDPDAAKNQRIAAQRLGPALSTRAEARARTLLAEIEARRKQP